MTHVKRIFLVGFFMASAGCSTTGQHFAAHGLERSSFEMQCAKDQLQLKGLSAEIDKKVELGDQVGVTGCGKRSVYVLTPNGWLLNGQSQ
jgi:hypothetical protein